MEFEDNILPETIPSDLPPGVICIASGELSRYPSFCDSIINVLRPHGTRVAWNCGLNVAANFNSGVREMMADQKYQWAWIMGDDHEFDQTTLLRLLERDLDIVVPLVVRRQAPFIPVLFKEPYDGIPLGEFCPYNWDELPLHGLFEIHVAGSAGMLIKRKVFEEMEDPWFETGRMGKDITNEDTYFCWKARKLGFKILADMDVQLGHWTPMSLWPNRGKDMSWTALVDVGQGVKLSMPSNILIGMIEEAKRKTKDHYSIKK